MEIPSLATKLRKILLWLTLACFSRKFVQKQIDWTGGTDIFSQKRSKWAWFYLKVGVASKISRAYGKRYGSKIRPKESLRHSLISYVYNRKCAAFKDEDVGLKLETYVYRLNVRSRESIGRSEKINVRLSCGRKVQDKDVLLWLGT